jgi:pyruvate dehydrogenase E2 component (dihydrolipoamide acetyltransferase)
VASEIVMPQMGAEMEEGAVVRWLKQPGDHIARGESIAEIETDKATVDLESFEEGYFLGSAVELGKTVPVGMVIGYLGAQGEQAPAGMGGTDAATASAPDASASAERQAAAPTQDGGQGAAQPEGQPAGHATEAEPARPAAASSPRAAPGAPERDTANGYRGAAASPQSVPEGGRLRVSPVARSIAAELGIDLSGIRGSGPEGRIMRRDVEEFARTQTGEAAAAPAQPAVRAELPAATPEAVSPVAEAPAAARPEAKAPVAAATALPPPSAAPVAPAAAAGGIEPLSKMRQAIARRMAAAKREMPHYYVTASVDMVEALALRKQINASLSGGPGGETPVVGGPVAGSSGGPALPARRDNAPNSEELRISINDLIVKACAIALERHPHFNATFTDEGMRRNPAINIGIAVALEDGLVAPAVLNCQGKSLGAIAREARDVAERARTGHLRQAELSDGTFTVSNLGMYGVETLIAIIQPGQAAILGVGKVEQRPVVRDGEIVARDTMTIALSADHRATDGAQGARFLAEIKTLLEQPIRLAL